MFIGLVGLNHDYFAQDVGGYRRIREPTYWSGRSGDFEPRSIPPVSGPDQMGVRSANDNMGCSCGLDCGYNRDTDRLNERGPRPHVECSKGDSPRQQTPARFYGPNARDPAFENHEPAWRRWMAAGKHYCVTTHNASSDRPIK